jgi:CelD/BcsL family acetyltransferase involved in cellulose biosynthesis
MYGTPDELLEYHKLARQVSSKTYQERLFDSGLPDTESFIAEMVALAERDLVRGFLLFHGDRPVAYLYTPAPDGFLIHECLGYDPAYAEHSPGSVLQYLAIQHLHAEGRFPIYYWGTGHSQTKEIFATNKMLGADIYYFRPTARNRMAVYGHHGMDRFASRAGQTLDRLHLKQRVRRWLRRQ